jgi:hypothetical protein
VSESVKTEPAEIERYVSRIDRRTTLIWLGAAAAAFSMAGPNQGLAETPAAKGYGTNPNLLNPTVPWPRILTHVQLQSAALLCDFILPASEDAPSASAVGVPDFIDEWVSAPYPAQTADRPVILDGLKWLEDEASHRYGAALSHIAPADRTALLQALTVKPSGAAMAGPHAFFSRFRVLTIGAYYTTEAGFNDIGYIGNVAMASYPGPSDEVKAVLDRELKKLGL